MQPNVLFAFSLTIIAGLSTGIGSLLAYTCKHTYKGFLSLALGFSAGVMIYVSMIEIMGKSRITLVEALGNKAGNWACVGSFFAGMALIAVIDKLVPSVENPHEAHSIEEMNKPVPKADHDHKLMRMGVMSAIAITIHNFPEGLATFTAALADPNLGIPITVAIAIHNIPEGIAVAVPIYYATKNRKKAFAYSFLSGLTEPVGALVGYFLLMSIMTPTTFGVIFGAVAGIMVFISLDELLPTAEKYGHHHLAIYGIVAGMAVMATSLLLFI